MTIINNKSLLEVNAQLSEILNEDIDDLEHREMDDSLSTAHEEWIAESWMEWATEEDFKPRAKSISDWTIEEFENALETMNERSEEESASDNQPYFTHVSLDKADKLIAKMAKEFVKDAPSLKGASKSDLKKYWSKFFKGYARKSFFQHQEIDIEYDHPSLTAWERNQ